MNRENVIAFEMDNKSGLIFNPYPPVEYTRNSYHFERDYVKLL